MTEPASPAVRFGVAGCADIAWRRTLSAMVADPRIELVAVASRSGVKAARFAGRFGALAVTGYQALLDRPDITAVYLPLPAVLHAEWIERALLAGKHVLAEKPLTTSAAATAELLRRAGQAGLVLMENVMFVHHSQHAEVHRLIAADAIGELRGLAAAFTIPPKPDGDIRYRSDVGGGALLDIGGYPVRTALEFLGPELRFAGGVLRHDRTRDVIISGNVLLCNAAGLPAQLAFGMEHSYRTRYECFGSAGVLRLDRAFTPPDSHQPVLQLERQDYRAELTLPADRQFANSLRFFVDAVLGAADADAAGRASLRQARLIDDIAAKSEVVAL